jgi:hypothetical protein
MSLIISVSKEKCLHLDLTKEGNCAISPFIAVQIPPRPLQTDPGRLLLAYCICQLINDKVLIRVSRSVVVELII